MLDGLSTQHDIHAYISKVKSVQKTLYASFQKESQMYT